jgi:hypothetical protein
VFCRGSEFCAVSGHRGLRGLNLLEDELSGGSGSPRSRRLEKLGCRFFGRVPEDRVFFLQFWNISQLGGWLTKDQLQSYRMDKTQPGGGTALYDALSVACQMRMGQRDWRKPTRRVLLLISDGEDKLSHVKPEEALSEALKAGAVIFTINNEAWNSQMKGKKTMES